MTTIDKLFCTPEQGKRLKDLVPTLTSAMVWEFDSFNNLRKQKPMYFDAYMDQFISGKYKNIDTVVDHAFKVGYIAPALTLQELRDLADSFDLKQVDYSHNGMKQVIYWSHHATYSTAPELAVWVIERLEETV